MSQPSQANQINPCAPAAIRQWIEDQGQRPKAADIRCECYRRRIGFAERHSSPNDINSRSNLHRAFCENPQDRYAVWTDFVLDLHDSVSAMSRMSDGLFVAFAVRPDWDPSTTFNPSRIDINTFTSYHADIKPSIQTTIKRLEDIFRKEIAEAHIRSYGQRLRSVTPGTGYVVVDGRAQMPELSTTPPAPSSSQPAPPKSRSDAPIVPPPSSAPPRLVASSSARNVSISASSTTSTTLSSVSSLSTSTSASGPKAVPPRASTSTPPASRIQGRPTSQPAQTRLRLQLSPSPAPSAVTPAPVIPAPVTPTSSRRHLQPRPPPITTVVETNEDSYFTDSDVEPLTPLPSTPVYAPSYRASTIPTSTASPSPPPSPTPSPRHRSATWKGKKAVEAPVSTSSAATGDGLLARAADFISGLGLGADAQASVAGAMKFKRHLWVALFMEAVMAESSTGASSRPKRTTEQIQEGYQRYQQLMQAIQSLRGIILQGIAGICNDYGRTPEWVSTQVYLGAGNVPRTETKPNGFGAFLSHTYATQVANGETLPAGAGAMTSVSQSAAQAWHALSDEEKQEWSRRSRQNQEGAKKKVKVVNAEHVANAIETTFTRKIDPCVAEITQSTGCAVLYLVTRDKVTDQYRPRSFASPRVEAALMYLFKVNPHELAMRLDAYVTGGITGVTRYTGDRRVGVLRKSIREMILQKLRNILRTARSVVYEELPTFMEWANYEKWVIEYGVELHGFPGGAVKNPSNVSTIPMLTEIEAAITQGECFWRVLEPEEWERRKADAHKRVLAERPSNNATTGKRKRSKTDHPTPPASTGALDSMPPTPTLHLTTPTILPSPSLLLPPPFPEHLDASALSYDFQSSDHSGFVTNPAFGTEHTTSFSVDYAPDSTSYDSSGSGLYTFSSSKSFTDLLNE
ncbi:hypothetical protein CONPUDRAFT_74160 [Coniophora puteana RWD-64-598 SS2]|uniref:Uncharacterized protein n=1 Tax=Coniophora puteana (strain RWD-64-598) TaxID=741705 RepID=A0A5M3MM25_CONPW|nr:uncharacterized protein CONPUDRAFT_74160 [Coniophora puteana RWD-64-598 SS2]EIW79824.1 hypothetical protein CONPUDRAFT_74160 [Coniophora puteana RWD-64-598 SS2]